MQHKPEDAPPPNLRNWPDEWWLSSSKCNLLTHLLVQQMLGLAIAVVDHEKIQKEVFSGLIFRPNRNEKRVCWLTAGHCIQMIRDIQDSQDLVIEYMRWVDCGERLGAESVPLHTRGFADQYWTNGEGNTEDNLDFGVAILTDMDAANILANDQIRPVTPMSWLEPGGEDPECYILAGFPAESVQLRLNSVHGTKAHGSMTFPLCCLPIQKVTPPRRPKPNLRSGATLRRSMARYCPLLMDANSLLT